MKEIDLNDKRNNKFFNIFYSFHILPVLWNKKRKRKINKWHDGWNHVDAFY